MMLTMTRVWSAVIVSLAASAALSAQANAPTQEERAMFRRYPVASVFRGIPASPDLSDPDARFHRTRLRAAARGRVNFAGHYRTAVWGCGSGCIILALIEAKSGKVFWFPGSISTVREKGEPLTFRLDSRAVHVIGAINEEDSADRWYEWTGREFKLISRKPAELEDDIP